MDMVRRSDYKKAVDYGSRYIDRVYHYSMLWRALHKLEMWLAGLGPARTIEARKKQERQIVYPLLERIGELIAKDLERIGKEVYPQRFHRIYVEVARFLPIAIYEGLSMRQVAERLGVSWRTVRDALWYMRRVGFELPEPAKVLPYR